MSTADPLTNSTTDQKPREPSMEEILASIRRIIADDQSLPKHEPIAAPGPSRPSVPFDAPPLVDSAHGPGAPLRQGSHRQEMPTANFRQPEALPSEHRAQAAPTQDRAGRQGEPHEPTHRHGSITPQFPVPPMTDDHARSAVPTGHQPPPLPTWPSPPPATEETGAHTGEFESDDVVALHHHHSTAPAGVAPDAGHDAHSHAEEPDEAYDMAIVPEPEDAPTLFSASTDTAVTSAFNMLAATRLADNSEELKAMVREMIRPLLRSWLDDNLPTMVERMVRAEIERVARGGR